MLLLGLRPKKMRLLIHAKIPTEAGNPKVQDPNLLSKLETYRQCTST
jgi:hypothetical protein